MQIYKGCILVGTILFRSKLSIGFVGCCCGVEIRKLSSMRLPLNCPRTIIVALTYFDSTLRCLWAKASSVAYTET